MSQERQLKITLVRSGIGRPEPHKKIIRALGLKKRGRSVIRDDRPEIQGMLRKIPHLVEVESVSTDEK